MSDEDTKDTPSPVQQKEYSSLGTLNSNLAKWAKTFTLSENGMSLYGHFLQGNIFAVVGLINGNFLLYFYSEIQNKSSPR